MKIVRACQKIIGKFAISLVEKYNDRISIGSLYFYQKWWYFKSSNQIPNDAIFNQWIDKFTDNMETKPYMDDVQSTIEKSST